MSTLTSFNVTEDWQEITGVSGITNTFMLQNMGNYKFFLYEGDTPVDSDAYRVYEKQVYSLVNKGVKVWVRSTGFTRITVTTTEDLSTPFKLKVSQGRISGASFVAKYGRVSGVNTLDAPVDVTEIGGLYNYDANNTAPIVSLISSSALDLEPISITGLDINGEEVTQILTLTGLTRVALTTPLWRVYRMGNEGSNDLAGIVSCYIGAGGAPVQADTRAVITVGNNQTLMAIYTIPLGKVGFFYRGEIGMSRSQATGTVDGATYARSYGKTFKNRKEADINGSGSSLYQDVRVFPDPLPALLDIKMTANGVSSNGTGVFAAFDILLEDETNFPQSYLDSIGQPSST